MRRALHRAAKAGIRHAPEALVAAALGAVPPARYMSARDLAALDHELQLRSVSFTSRVPGGGKLSGRTDDAIQRIVLLTGGWEPNLTSFVRRRLAAGDVFVDVGANVGYFSLVASPLVGRTGLVVAIEASPSVFGELEANISRNGWANIVPLNVAAGDVRGQLPIYLSVQESTGHSTVLPGSTGFALAEEATVEAFPLADVLPLHRAEDIRLIKIDVESFEHEVVGGLAGVLDRLPRVELVVEITPSADGARPSPEAILEVMGDAGFHPYVLPNSYRLDQQSRRSTSPATRLDGPIATLTDVAFSRVDAPFLY